MRVSLISLIIIVGLGSCNQNSKTPQHRGQDTLNKSISSVNRQVILFVQWQYPNSTDGLKALDVRQNTEALINQSLKAAALGQWIAGDLGPGGANMLFEVNNAEKVLSLIIEILKEQLIQNESVIAIDNGVPERGAIPSNFKVIYPKTYRGVFNDR